MKKTIFSIFIIIFVGSLFSADFGKFMGVIFDSKTEKVIPYVNIIIVETGKGLQSDKKGKFAFEKIPVGEYKIQINRVGHKILEMKVQIKKDETTFKKIFLEKNNIKLSKLVYSTKRKEQNRLAIQSNILEKEDIQENYSNQDLQEMMESESGVFISKNGLGASQLKIRGFGEDKVQLIVNGISVNNPLNQEITWENWSGLTSATKKIDIQKGTGYSLYGSGSFGGSINIETMDIPLESNFSIRTSGAYYDTSGDVIDFEGETSSNKTKNYSALLKYNSGEILESNFAFSLIYERKEGDYYLYNTSLVSDAINLELQKIINKHILRASFVYSPQKSENLYKKPLVQDDISFSYKSDPSLFSRFGREYNRVLDSEASFSKPMIVLRDEWRINDFQNIKTNLFVTKGNNKNTYGNASTLDIETGEMKKEIYIGSDDIVQNYANNARFVYENYGITLPGYNGVSRTYVFEGSYYEAEESNNIFSITDEMDSYHTFWENNEVDEHLQFGGNCSFSKIYSDGLEFNLGSDWRLWKSHNFLERSDYLLSNDEILKNMPKTYDLDTKISNLTLFGRANFKITDKFDLFIDGKYQIFESEIEENPIKLYDFKSNSFIDEEIYISKDLIDFSGRNLFSESDYKKTFKFLSPKFGINYLITNNLNFFVNTSSTQKEPTLFQWYNSKGPSGPQTYSFEKTKYINDNYYITITDTLTLPIEPEKIHTLECGTNFGNENFSLGIDLYYSKYTDKIENVQVDIRNADVVNHQNHQEVVYYYVTQNLTYNIGDAVHKGIELSSSGKFGNFDFSSSYTISRNRWKKINGTNIFGGESKDVIDKVVPFSPELMSSSAIYYSFEEIPFFEKIKIGTSSRWWNNYFANYENEYSYTDSDNNVIRESSKLPAFFETNLHLKTDFSLGNKDIVIKLDLNNIFNREENYSSGVVETDYNRIPFVENGTNYDYLDHKRLYVTPAPLFNLFLSTEIIF